MLFRVAVLVLILAVSGRAAWADDIKDQVRSVLKEHPEILIEAIRSQSRAVLEVIEDAARGRQKELEKKRFLQELSHPIKPEVGPNRATLGPEKAPVTIVEYSDFLCHFCAQASSTIKTLLERHPSDVRLVFKHFATGKIDELAARDFEAINLQDPAKAWAFHDQVFARRDEVADKGEKVLDEIAKAVGADTKRMAEDAKRKDIGDRIQADVKEAKAFGFEGTPVFVINGAAVRGAAPLDVFEEDVRLAKEAAAGGMSPAKAPGQ